MAETLPKRADTLSTLNSDHASREDADTSQEPSTQLRSRTVARRMTLSDRKLVFYDPVAFRYLEEDESTIVLARQERLQGYELYIVEQWVCSRVHPTFVITTYTGDPAHSILVNVLAVPNDEKNWSPRLKIYFDAVSQFQAREQETLLGTLMVTNLSAFPSGLIVISVPGGDVKKHREDFIVNQNLKRMGCMGRAAMNLQPAPSSTVAKFQHLYQTSESIPFKPSVMELVRLCQTALVLYGKLNTIYADGLLCDITEKAIQEWWNDIGTDFHNLEPSDGILGPTTVAALIGLMLGAYNRLRTSGVNVPKDVLDVMSMKRAIGHFQKAYRLHKTRRLDRNTLDRLHRVTAKTANSDGWAVPRAVKSTVTELSGKGGEMVMGAIGANKERTSITEIETLEIDKLAQLAPGAKMKWLWQGKPLKSNRMDLLSPKTDDGLNGRVFGTDDQGNYLWTSRNKNSIATIDDGDADVQGHEKSNLQRLRGAVGIPNLRPHHNRPHRHVEEHLDRDEISGEMKSSRLSKELARPDHLLRSPSSFISRRSLERQNSNKPAINLALANADPGRPPPSHSIEQAHARLHAAQDRSNSPQRLRHEQLRGSNQSAADTGDRASMAREIEKIRDDMQSDDFQKFATEFEEYEPEASSLRRSKSGLLLREVESPIAYDLMLPRQLSFSLVENSIFKFPAGDKSNVNDTQVNLENENLQMKMSSREVEEKALKQLFSKLLRIEQNLLLYAQAEVMQVKDLDQESREHLSELNEIYYQRLDDYQSLQATSRDLVAREKASLNDGLRNVEILGQKLDYELDALYSKMQEVEDGAIEFERNVAEIEARVAELVHERKSTVTDESDDTNRSTFSSFHRARNFFGNSSSST